MADQASITVYDDAATPVVYTFVPRNALDGEAASWLEQSSTKSQMAKGRMGMKRDVQKNGLERRLFKVELPILETPSAVGADMYGNTAAPKVAYVVPAQVQMFVPERATDQDVANALKMLLNTITGTVSAGTGQATLNSVAPVTNFLVSGIVPD